MKIFISGGCKNGKSTHAQELALSIRRKGKPLYYVATMIPKDDEDRLRIENHRRERFGTDFETIEIFRDIENLLTFCDTGGTFLIDALTSLLAGEIFGDGYCPSAGEKVKAGLEKLFARIDNIIIVSDYIYSDAESYDDMTEDFRRSLALLDRTCCEHCEIVLEALCGNIVAHKGEEIYNECRQGVSHGGRDVHGHTRTPRFVEG